MKGFGAQGDEGSEKSTICRNPGGGVNYLAVMMLHG